MLGELGIEIGQDSKTARQQDSKTARQQVNDNLQIWAVYSEAIEKRFDPMYYHPLRMQAVEAIKKSTSPVFQLKEVVKFRRELVNYIPENASYVGLENIVSNSGEYIETNVKDSISSAFVFKKGDILFPKLRPYLNKVFFADFDGVCSTEFHVFESKRCNAYFLFSFLSRSVVVEQTSRLMTGNTLPRLQTEDIENLLIPIPNETTQEKISESVKTIYENVKDLRYEAKNIVLAAQEQVEHMIFT